MFHDLRILRFCGRAISRSHDLMILPTISRSHDLTILRTISRSHDLTILRTISRSRDLIDLTIWISRHPTISQSCLPGVVIRIRLHGVGGSPAVVSAFYGVWRIPKNVCTPAATSRRSIRDVCVGGTARPCVTHSARAKECSRRVRRWHGALMRCAQRAGEGVFATRA